jgi:hypothetical protein
MPHLTPSTFAVAAPAARTRFGLRKSTWRTLLLASLMATLGAVCSEPAKAVPINIIVTGTISTANTGMGYAVGDTVSFTWQVRDFTPPPNVNVNLNPNNAAYIQENATEPVLWSGIFGTGISGTYVPLSTGSQPFSRLQVGWTGVFANLMSAFLGADVTTGPSLNQGLYLTADPTYWIDDFAFRAGLTGVGFGSITAPAPTPAAYLSNYVGTYTAFANVQFVATSEIRATNGSATKIATFDPLSVEISLVQAVPEIDPAGMGSVLALVGGALGLLERRRRVVA